MNTPRERAAAALSAAAVLSRRRTLQERADRALMGSAQLTEPLSRREREALRLLLEGLNPNDIALEMDVAQSTADTHIRHLCEKTGVSSPGQAALFAVQQPSATRRGAAFRKGLHMVDATCPCGHCKARREAA
jgi:DNA-binding NarL/FixJ family response regulator